MVRSISLLCAAALLTGSVTAGAAASAPKPRSGLIVPGHSIARMEIGMTAKQVRAIYGRPDHVSHPILEETHETLTDYRYHRPGLRAEFSHDGKLITIYAYSDRQRTAGGSGVGTTERRLKKDVGVRCADQDLERWCLLEGDVETIFLMKHGRVDQLWVIDTVAWGRP